MGMLLIVISATNMAIKLKQIGMSKLKLSFVASGETKRNGNGRGRPFGEVGRSAKCKAAATGRNRKY